MEPRKALALRREALAELRADELGRVEGGDNTETTCLVNITAMSCSTCLLSDVAVDRTG